MAVRKSYLDGLRGLAAFSVLLFHANVYIAMALPWEVTGRTHQYLMRFFNGNFAVCIFFILSGYVLSFAATKSDKYHHAGEMIIKRYFRLTPTVCVSVILAYFLWKTIGFYTSEMATYAPVFNWMAHEYQFKPSFLWALYEGLIGVYKGQNSYNGVLWTINIEMFGSIIVYVMIRLFWDYKNFIPIVIATLVLMFVVVYNGNTYYFALFIAGMMLCRRSPPLHWIFIIPAIYLGSVDQWAKDALYLCNLVGIQIDSFEKTIPFHAVGAVMLLMCVLSNEKLKEFLSLMPFRFLGRISYSLYAVHIITIFSMGNFIFIKLAGTFSHITSGILSLLAVIMISFVIAYIFTRVIDEPAQKYAGRIARFILNGRTSAKVAAPSVEKD